MHTPLVGLEVDLPQPGSHPGSQPGSHRLPLEPDFEYAALMLTGSAELNAVALEPGSLLYLGRRHRELSVQTSGPARMFVIGGVPFEDPLVMWWNFVARSHEEIVQAREDWMAGRRFGRVADCEHPPLPAPELPTVRLKARDRHGETLD